MRALATLLCLVLLWAGPALAGLDVAPAPTDTSQFVRGSDVPALVLQYAPVTSVNGKTGAVVTATLPGFFGVQDGSTSPPLPDAAANAGRYANVVDLGGVGANGAAGTGLVYSNGSCWSRFRAQVATTQVVPLTAAVSITALSMSSTIQLSGNGLTTSAKLNIIGPCQGDVFHIIFPAGLLGAVGSVGVQINGGSLLAVPSLAGATTGTWADYSVNGNALTKIAGGAL